MRIALAAEPALGRAGYWLMTVTARFATAVLVLSIGLDYGWKRGHPAPPAPAQVEH